MAETNNASRAVVHEALQMVQQRYGDNSNVPDRHAVVRWLPYHNLSHSLAVSRRTARMGEALDLTAEELATAAMAAAAHDIVQEGGRGVMERASADWLERAMRARRFDTAAVAAARLAVLGTEPLIVEGVITGQMVSHLDFPSKGAERVAHAVAAADMGGLYLPSGPLESRSVYREERVLQSDYLPSLDGLEAFLIATTGLAEQFRFSHPAGEQAFGAFRGPVTDYHNFLLMQIQAGNVAGWDNLRWQDMYFRDSLKARPV